MCSSVRFLYPEVECHTGRTMNLFMVSLLKREREWESLDLRRGLKRSSLELVNLWFSEERKNFVCRRSNSKIFFPIVRWHNIYPIIILLSIDECNLRILKWDAIVIIFCCRTRFKDFFQLRNSRIDFVEIYLVHWIICILHLL